MDGETVAQLEDKSQMCVCVFCIPIAHITSAPTRLSGFVVSFKTALLKVIHGFRVCVHDCVCVSKDRGKGKSNLEGLHQGGFDGIFHQHSQSSSYTLQQEMQG